MVYILLWIACLGFSSQLSGPFLSPSGDALIDFGAKDNYRVQNYQFHRLILSNFLHGSFMHIFISVFTLFAFGFPLERKIGWLRLIFIHQICSILGTIFSSLIVDKMTVGGSLAIFGFLGIYIGFLMINFEEMENLGPMRCCLIILFIFYTIILILLTSSLNMFVDPYGHLGAFLTGIVCSLFAIPRISRPPNKTMTYIGAGILTFFGVLGIVLIVFVREFGGIYIYKPAI